MACAIIHNFLQRSPAHQAFQRQRTSDPKEAALEQEFRDEVLRSLDVDMVRSLLEQAGLPGIEIEAVLQDMQHTTPDVHILEIDADGAEDDAPFFASPTADPTAAPPALVESVSKSATTWRDKIAEKMWSEYEEAVRSRSRELYGVQLGPFSAKFLAELRAARQCNPVPECFVQNPAKRAARTRLGGVS